MVTDALDMAGLTRLYSANTGRAAVDAFKAGSDLLLIPADLDASYNAVLEAARSGEIPSAQLDASVLKLLKAKASLGLHKARLVDLNALSDIVGKPENLALGQQISDAAVTLVRDNGKLLPLETIGNRSGRTSVSTGGRSAQRDGRGRGAFGRCSHRRGARIGACNPGSGAGRQCDLRRSADRRGHVRGGAESS